MIKEVDRAIIEYLAGKEAFSGTNSAEFSYISNPDGTIRWIYPKNMKYPMFLNFYNTASLRAKIFSNLIKLAFLFRQFHYVKSGDLRIHVSNVSRLNNILTKYNYSEFSVFTGTVGENRKVLIEVHNDRETLVFVKIALEDTSKKLVFNESKQLCYLKKFNFKHLVTPEVLSISKDGIIELTNIKPNNYKQSSKITTLHISILSELYIISNIYKKWSELKIVQECKQKLEALKKDYQATNLLEKSRIQRLSQNVLMLIAIIENDNKHVPLSIMHGDFTPWNMYISNNSLYLFDWELSKSGMPMMIDLFHFVFQSEIMIKHSDYSEIFTELSNILKFHNIQELVNTYNIELNKHYMFYLIYITSYYLTKYVNQNQLHDQAFWLINIWEIAVEDLLKKNGVVFN